MALPILLIAIATGASAFLAYGVHPDLAAFGRGLQMIVWARTLMWPLVAVSLISCIWLIGLVIAGKRRAWWLIGLAPVMALFIHRFGPGAPGPGGVIEMPPMIAATDPGAPELGDYVVGLIFEDRAYAFPYRALYAQPVVSLVDYDKRMLLMWSPFANRATAVTLNREIRCRDLEIVSNPANSILIYDRRLGQCIAGVNGKLTNGKPPVGFEKPIATEKVTWADWKTAHPETAVMLGSTDRSYPSRPILPQYKLRVPPIPDPATPIAMLATTPPAALREDVGMSGPVNVTVGQTRILILRGRAGESRAFDRHLKEDLFLTFQSGSARRRRDIAVIDVDTQSFWTLDGRCVEGSLKGERLKEIDIDPGLHWGVMKYWYPDLELIESR